METTARSKNSEKTNVMRLLDAKKIEYETFCYADTPTTVGTQVAELLGQDPNRVFKTLVTIASSGEHYVFVIPVCCELNLKKAAKSVGEKKIEMIKSKELLPLTGYIHGGCSPIGMKKFFRTVVNLSALDYEKIYFSAGKIGYQVSVRTKEIEKIIKVEFSDLVD